MVYQIKEGDTFNQLTALGFSHKAYGGRVIYWKFKCDCGEERVYPKNQVINLSTVSCGCRRAANLLERNTKHGDAVRGSRKRLNSIWSDMRRRCNNSKQINYHGRGITVCPDWDDSYIVFRKWALNNGYDNKLSIERIDNNSNYSPENCKWITMAKQAQNKRNSRMLEYKGKVLCAAEWARKYNIPYKTFHKRIQNGCTMEDALNF